MNDYPEKVLHEHYACDEQGCRKRGRFFMDGLAYCEEHIDKVPEYLRGMVRRIKYVLP